MSVLRVTAWIALLPALAVAAEGAHGEAHGTPWGKLFFFFVNFVLFVSLMKWLAWPFVRSWVIDRHDRIVATLEQAAHARREAEALRDQWEKRWAAWEQELAEMRERARADIDREREVILSAAERTAEAILRDAEQAARQQVQDAERMLREEVAQRALDAAREEVRRRMGPEDQRRMVDEFLSKVQA